jgi:integrase
MKGQVYYMPKAKKKANGQWRVTVYDYKDSTGRIHQKTFTAETKLEAERLANEYKDGPSRSDLTVGEAVKGYIDSKKSVLSPSTHRSYSSIYRTHFESSRFGGIKLSSLDNITVQRFISDLDLNPKTVRNVSGILTASIKMYMPNKSFVITLPAQKRPELHTPTTDEVNTLINSIKKDRELYICVMLCAFGPMRRSEACAIRYDDIDNKTNTITVRRARVQEANQKWVYKDMPKTDTSYRALIYPSEVVDAIGRGFGYVITKSTPQALTQRLSHALKRAGLPDFRLHDLRHYSASILHAIGIPDQYIMARGGWKTDNVMKRVYRDTLSDVEKEMNQKAVAYFEQSIKKQS